MLTYLYLHYFYKTSKAFIDFYTIKNYKENINHISQKITIT